MSVMCQKPSLNLLIALHLVCLPASLSAKQAASSPAITPEVQSLLDKANQTQSSYQWQEALTFLNQALEKARAAKDSRGEAVTLNNIGLVFLHRGQPQRALEQFAEALPILQGIGDKWGEGTTLTNIGGIYSSIGQPQKALEQFAKALTLRRQVANKGGEAVTLNNIGYVYLSLGQPQEALKQFEDALTLRRLVGDRRGEGTTLNNIGGAYLSLGQPQKALEQYHKALSLRREIQDKAGIAASLHSIGSVYSDLGQPQKALEQYQKALNIEREVGDKRGEGATLNNIGQVYLHLGQLQKALEQYQNALTLRRQVGDKRGEGTTLNNIGSVYSDLGQPQKALEQYQKALNIEREVGDKGTEAITLSNLALLVQEQGHVPAAIAYFKHTIDLNEQYREQIGTLSEDKITFLQGRLPNYHLLLHLLLQQKSVQTAFDLAQKTKARALVDLMASGRVNLNGKLTAEEQAEQQKRQTEVRRLHNALLTASFSNHSGSEKQTLQQALSQAERDLQTLQDQLANRHPDLQKQRGAKTVTLAEVAKFLPQDTALLEYVQLNMSSSNNKIRVDQVVLFVVTVAQGKASVEAYPLSGTNRQWRERSHDFISACSDPQADYEEKASALANQLLPPSARAKLSGKKHLLICPDGPLWGLPFQALRTPQGQFWLQQYEISYAYSATGAEAALSATKRKDRPAPSGTLLAFANPDFGGENRFQSKEPLPLLALKANPARPLTAESKRPLIAESKRSPITERGGIKPLEGTRKEAEALQADFPAGPPQVLVLTGKQAQKEIALREMGKYRYLHFATHGWFSDTSPLQSCVVLAEPPNEQKQQGEEGFLTARDLFDLNLSAEMVVLSACDTARGGNESGEGMVGLTWALFVAGVPTQVVSQWSVSDESTASLMQAFYSNLTKAKMAKGAALREAALHLQKDPQHRHPYYWAPFILLGDWK